MNKTELITEISKKTQISKKDSEKALNAFMDIVKETLADDDVVRLAGFGTFESKKRSARKGINPKTREEIRIKASRSPSFKPGRPFRDLLNKK